MYSETFAILTACLSDEFQKDYADRLAALPPVLPDRDEMARIMIHDWVMATVPQTTLFVAGRIMDYMDLRSERVEFGNLMFLPRHYPHILVQKEAEGLGKYLSWDFLSWTYSPDYSVTPYCVELILVEIVDMGRYNSARSELGDSLMSTIEAIAFID